MTKNTKLSNKLYSLSNEISTLEKKRQAIQNKVTMGSYQKFRASQRKQNAINLIPLIKILKRNKERFILPNGVRVRLGKINFVFKEKQKEGIEWNGVKFNIETTSHGVFINYSFSNNYYHLTGTIDPDKTKAAYNFNPESLISNNAKQDLKELSDSEIEAIAIYGERPVKQNLEREQEIAKLTKEIEELKLVRKHLSRLNEYIAIEDEIIELACAKKYPAVVSKLKGLESRSSYYY